MSRTVVVALDTSDLSAGALPIAQAIARDWRGELVFVHAQTADDSHALVPLKLELRRGYTGLREEAARAGRDPEHLKICTLVMPVCGESRVQDEDRIALIK